MHFSEDDLRSALKRKDPGEALTQRVMARIHQGESKAKAPTARLWLPGLRPLFASAMAAGVLLAATWFGIAQHRHAQRAREIAQGERAKQQAILALHIAHTKLNQVFERVKASSSGEPKINMNIDMRREHL